jgi:hypothetical protein
VVKNKQFKFQRSYICFSVGGGSIENNISTNLVEALKYGKSLGCKFAGIVGRDGGYTNKVADVCVLVPTVNEKTTTPHTEALQAVIWHLIISHPKLKSNETKWESVSKNKLVNEKSNILDRDGVINKTMLKVVYHHRPIH